MQRYKECSIGGMNLMIQQYTADRGTEVLVRLLKLIGEPMAIMTGVDAMKGQEKADAAKTMSDILGKAVGSLAMRSNEEEVKNLIEDLMSVVFVGPQPLGGLNGAGAWKMKFQGQLGVMFKVCIEVVKYNFQDFLSVVGAVAIGQAAPTE